MRQRPVILVTGATGTLGSLAAASLLAETEASLVLPFRRRYTPSSALAPMNAELAELGASPEPSRARALPIPDGGILELLPDLRAAGVDEIIHVAGCVDYFDTSRLDESNLALTLEALELGRQLGVRRFVFVSTAFCSGYSDTTITETLHADPSSDPTDYIRTKRMAERLVASSGLPFVIIRPTVVIGNSVDGRYRGKHYGLYQLWRAAEALFSSRYEPEFHVVASLGRLPLLHQDAFQSMLVYSRRHAPDGAIINLASPESALPTVLDVYRLWWQVTRPQLVYYYDNIDRVPMDSISQSQRALIEFATVNLEMATHRWSFETRWIETFRSLGMPFPVTSLGSLQRCQDWFVSQSRSIGKYIARIRPADSPLRPVERRAA